MKVTAFCDTKRMDHAGTYGGAKILHGEEFVISDELCSEKESADRERIAATFREVSESDKKLYIKYRWFSPLWMKVSGAKPAPAPRGEGADQAYPTEQGESPETNEAAEEIAAPQAKRRGGRPKKTIPQG